MLTRMPESYNTFTAYSSDFRTNTQVSHKPSKSIDSNTDINTLADEIWDKLDQDKSGSLTYNQFKVFLN